MSDVVKIGGGRKPQWTEESRCLCRTMRIRAPMSGGACARPAIRRRKPQDEQSGRSPPRNTTNWYAAMF